MKFPILLIFIIVTLSTGYLFFKWIKLDIQTQKSEIVNKSTPSSDSNIDDAKVLESTGNYLHLTKYLDAKPNTIWYVKNKNVVLELPKNIQVRNEAVRDSNNIQFADAKVTINGIDYYFANIAGWPGARYDSCETLDSTITISSNCYYSYPQGSIVSGLRYVSDDNGVLMLNVQDIKIETYHVDNFSIFKGPLNKNPNKTQIFFEGRFTNDEIELWKNLIVNIKTIAAE